VHASYVPHIKDMDPDPRVVRCLVFGNPCMNLNVNDSKILI